MPIFYLFSVYLYMNNLLFNKTFTLPYLVFQVKPTNKQVQKVLSKRKLLTSDISSFQKTKYFKMDFNLSSCVIFAISAYFLGSLLITEDQVWNGEVSSFESTQTLHIKVGEFLQYNNLNPKLLNYMSQISPYTGNKVKSAHLDFLF